MRVHRRFGIIVLTLRGHTALLRSCSRQPRLSGQILSLHFCFCFLKTRLEVSYYMISDFDDISPVPSN